MALLIYLNVAPQSAAFADGDQDPHEVAIEDETYRYLPETRYAVYKPQHSARVGFKVAQYPSPQRYCHAIPTALNSLPVWVVRPVLA